METWWKIILTILGGTVASVLSVLCCCKKRQEEDGTSFDGTIDDDVDEEAEQRFKQDNPNFTFAENVHAIASGMRKPNREALSTGQTYNCWGFAIQPITKRLVNKNPKCYSPNNTTVEQLANGIKKEINDMNSQFGCTAEDPFLTAEEAMNNLSANQYLIAVRVANKNGGGGYHCIRYCNGKWEYKQHKIGSLINLGENCNPDENDAWKVYCSEPDATTAVWNPDDGSAFMPFKSKTMYIRVTLQDNSEACC